jgi:hypothetical protein
VAADAGSPYVLRGFVTLRSRSRQVINLAIVAEIGLCPPSQFATLTR